MKTATITSGAIWKGLLSFFFPILLGTFFQQLYNTVDAVIVGRFVNTKALAAVGGGTAIFVNLLVGFFVGVASGSGVVISQFFGAQNERETSMAVHSALVLSLIGGIAVMLIGLAACRPAMHLIGTPDEIMDLSLEYLRIYFYGMIPLLLYNMGAGILRASGNSLAPFVILLAGCAANIVLDITLVVALGMGVAGVAWATLASQLLCACLTLAYLSRTGSAIRFDVKRLCFAPHIVRSMVRIGLPAGLQGAMYTVSNLIIQSNINRLGTQVIAAAASWSKIDAAFWMTVNAFGMAMTTFAGQNYGAGKPERVRRGTAECLAMCAGATVIFSVLICAFARQLLRIFTSDEAVIGYGMEIARLVAPTFIAYISVEILSGTIRGCGQAVIPTLITLVAVCLLRVVWMFAVVRFHRSILMIFISYPVTWTVSSALFWLYYKKGKWC